MGLRGNLTKLEEKAKNQPLTDHKVGALTDGQGSADRGLPVTETGSGTGFMVSKDGLLLTNRHVAAG